MKKFTLFIVLFYGALTACDSLVDGLNDDPNRPTEAPSDNILTGTEVALIQALEGDLARRCGMWCGYFVGEAQQYEGFYNYLPTAGDFNANWEDLYANVVRNSRVTAQVAESEGNTGIITGISNILYALGTGTSTSLWGKVPFSEAGDFDNFPTPSYEEQLNIYGGLQNLLDLAIIQLASGTGRPAAGADIFFDGDPEQWTQVAYTLKARFFMEIKDYQNAYDAALMGINDPDNSMLATHNTSQGTENLYHQFLIGNRGNDLSASNTRFVELLNPASPEYRGNTKTNETERFNFLLAVSGSNTVLNSGGIFAIDQVFPIVSYQENILTLAEAGTRAQSFDTGLRAI